MALTAKLEELWALLPEGLDKSSQYTIKIGKEIAYKGNLTGNSKIDSMGSEDVDAVIAAIQGGNQKRAITITNESKEKLFYRDSKGKTQVNTFEKPLEVDEFDEEPVSSSEEIQSAIDAFGIDPEELAPESPEVPENAMPSAIYYLESRMIAVGRGMFPYECTAKDEHPDAMVYYSQSSGWAHEFDAVFKNRDVSRDEFEPIQTLTRDQITDYMYDGTNPYTPEQSAVVTPEPEKAARLLSDDYYLLIPGIEPAIGVFETFEVAQEFRLENDDARQGTIRDGDYVSRLGRETLEPEKLEAYLEEQTALLELADSRLQEAASTAREVRDEEDSLDSTANLVEFLDRAGLGELLSGAAESRAIEINNPEYGRPLQVQSEDNRLTLSDQILVDGQLVKNSEIAFEFNSENVTLLSTVVNQNEIYDPSFAKSFTQRIIDQGYAEAYLSSLESGRVQPTDGIQPTDEVLDKQLAESVFGKLYQWARQDGLNLAPDPSKISEDAQYQVAEKRLTDSLTLKIEQTDYSLGDQGYVDTRLRIQDAEQNFVGGASSTLYEDGEIDFNARYSTLRDFPQQFQLAIGKAVQMEPEELVTPAQIEALKEELATEHLDLAREQGEVFITGTREGNLRLTRLDGYLDVFELTKTVAPGLEVSLAGGYEDVIRSRLKELYIVGEPELEVEAIAPEIELDPVETPDADGFAVGDRVQFISPNPISYDVIPPSHQTVGEVLEVNRSGESLLIQFNDGEPPEFWDSINFEPENQIAEKVEFVDRRAVDKSITFAELEGQSAAETQQPSEPINVLDQLAVGDRQLEELKAATGLSEENLIEFLNTVQSAADKKLERLEEDFYDPEEEYAELEAEFSDTTTINYDPREESEWDTVNEAPEIESTARPSLSPYIEPYLPIEGAESNFESFYEWAENSEVGLNFSISKQDQAERDMGMFFLAPEAATINLTTQINLEFRKINYELADAQSESIAIFIADMEGNSAAILKKTKHSETVEYTGELRNAEALTSNYKDLPNKFHLALGIVETANQDRQAQALETEPAPQTDSHYIHLVSSPLGEGLGEGEIIGPFESLDAAVEFRRNVITQNPEVFLAGTFNESFFDPSEIDQAVAPGVLLEAIRSTIPSGIANTPEQSIAPKTDIAPEPAITPKRAPEKPNRFSFKGLGKAFQEKLQETFAAQKDKLPASAIALLELHDSKLKDPALAWVSRKLEEAKPELTALREQIQKTSVDAARKGLEAIGNIPNAILEQSVSNAVVNVMDKLGSDTEIEGTQHYLSENYVIARNGNSYQLKDLDGKELLYFDQGKLGNTVTSNSLNRLQVSDLLRANQQITLMSETPSLQEKVSLGNIAPLFSREKLKREQDCQVSGILKAAIAIRGQPQPNGDRVFAGETFHAKQSGDRIQLSRSDGADLLFAIDATSKNAEVNNLNPKEFAQILKFGAALDQVKTSQAKAQAKPSLAAR